MARKAREKSELGIYLINLKSVENLVFSSEDKINFLNIVLKNNTKLLSYTLLDNSFFLVIKEENKPIDLLVRQSSIKFVKEFNKLNNRQGKVFYSRYTSFPANNVEDVWNFISNTHFMAVLNKCIFSSVKDYFNNAYVDSKYALTYFPSKKRFEEKCNKQAFIEPKIKLNDEELTNYITNIFNIQPSNISKLSQTTLDNIIYEVVKGTKASARQLARITSLPLRMLWNIVKNLKPKPKGVVKNGINNK